MKKLPKLSAKQVDNEIKRINRQIAQAAKTFGKESRYYQNYEAMLFPRSGTGIGSANFVRYNKQGIIQISRSKGAIAEMEQITQYQKALYHLGQVPTVKETKSKMIKSYEERNKVKLKRKLDIEKAIIEEVNAFNELERGLKGDLREMYEAEQERGVIFVNHNELKKLSKGRNTDKETLEKMRELAQRALQADAEIVTNVIEGW